MIFYDVQSTVTYGNMQASDADVDERCHDNDDDALVYANIEQSATAESQYRSDEPDQQVVYSELQSP